MPGRDPITQLGDLTALQANLDKIIEMTMTVTNAIKSVPEISVAYKNSAGGAELKKNTEDLIAINKLLDASMQKIASSETELQSVRESGAAKSKKMSDEQLRASIQARAETKARTDAIKAEGDAYKQLALEYNKAAAEAKRLQAVALKTGLKEDAEAAKLAAASANAMNTALKSMDKAVGDTRRNVGNYKEALEQLERELYGVRMAMVKVAGQGDSVGSEMDSLKLHAGALVSEIERLKEESHSAGEAMGEGGLLGGIKEFGKELVMQAAMFIGIYQAFDFFKESIQEILHAQQEASKLNNILTNIGRTDVFGRLQEKAKGLAEEFKTIKSEDLVGVFDKLVVYGKLTENQISELTPVIINFAAQTGQSLEESTSVIIKALEGNARGLKEFGINIKKGSDEAENFGKVMTELAPRVEGAAKAFGETTAGEIQKTTVQIDELKKEIGEKLEPAYKNFLQGLADGMSGIPQLFEAITNSVVSNFNILLDAGKTTWYTLKGIFTHDFSDLAFYDLQKQKIQENIKSAKEWAQVNGFAKEIAQDASTRSLQDQQKLLTENISLRDRSAQIWADMVAEGKKNSDEGHKAFMQLAQDQAIVAALYKVIEQSKDKRVLGVGGGDNEKKQDFTDYEEGFKQLREEFQKFHDEAFGATLDPYLKELANLQQKYQDGYIKINDTRDKDLAKVKENEEKKIITSQQAGKERVKIENDTEEARLAAETAYYANLNALQEKHRQEVAAKRKEQTAKDFKDAVDSQKRIAKAMGEDADSHFREQVTVAKNNDKANPSFGNNKALADAERDQQIHNQTKLLQDQKITQAEFDSDMVAIQNEHAKKMGDAYAKQFTQYGDYAKQAFNLVDGLEKAAAERTINNIQRQIDANNKLKETATARIESEKMGETEKAAALANLDAKTAANNEALERKQRDAKIKAAEFEKANTIMKISLATAEAVAKDITTATILASDPLTAALAPNAYVQAGIAAAEGAAELTVAAAAPIPKYAGGTSYSKAGLALTDERGPEGYITPSGKAFLGNDQPTLRFLEAGTKIIPHEKLRDYQSMQLLPRVQQDRQLERKLDQLNGTMERMEQIGQQQIAAIKKVRLVPPSSNTDPAFWAHVYNSCKH